MIIDDKVIDFFCATDEFFKKFDEEMETCLFSDNDNLVRPKVFCYFAANFSADRKKRRFITPRRVSLYRSKKRIVNECFLLGRVTHKWKLIHKRILL